MPTLACRARGRLGYGALPLPALHGVDFDDLPILPPVAVALTVMAYAESDAVAEELASRGIVLRLAEVGGRSATYDAGRTRLGALALWDPT